MQPAQAYAQAEGRQLRGVELRQKPPRTEPPAKLLGSDPVMIALQDCIGRVAASKAPVLIGGETGSGKDLVARAIHAQGPRGDGPFVSVNIAAVPEALLESEMFGHVRGAFTGASDARHGLFVAAEGGTLFLDELGDMPLGLQAKLLRVLELGELRPVGSDRVRSVDVRLIAATHRSLPRLIQKGRFREDLYFRLNILPVAVPPLRQRRGDIAELALHFLEQARLRMPTSPVRVLSPGVLELLSRANWPGNVRELASTVERLVVFGRQATITPGDPILRGMALGAASPDETVELCTLRELNERHTALVLMRTGGDKARAAEILGVNLSTLYRWRAEGSRAGSTRTANAASGDLHVV